MAAPADMVDPKADMVDPRADMVDTPADMAVMAAVANTVKQPTRLPSSTVSMPDNKEPSKPPRHHRDPRHRQHPNPT